MTLGQTTFVVVVNPLVNTDNGVTVPEPGTVRSGINVAAYDGAAVRTNAGGVAVLSPVTAGAYAMSLQGGGLTGSTGVSIADHDLHELALALTNSGMPAFLSAGSPAIST